MHRLDAELDFVVKFHLPSPTFGSKPLWLLDSRWYGRWEVGITIQVAIVKSFVQMVTCL